MAESRPREKFPMRAVPPISKPFASRAAWRFLLIAAATMAAFYGLYFFPHAEGSVVGRAIDLYLRATARGARTLIALVDAGVGVQGTVITGRFPLTIIKSCSSLDAQALFAAAVCAFPVGPRWKAIGLAAGLTLLTLLNLLRIAGLWWVGVHAPAYFDRVHEEVFPLLLVVAACACFGAWALRSRRNRAAVAS
jgi:exosortase/archaeosortase family protein